MVDYEKLRQLKRPVDLVLSYDLEKLRSEDEIKRTDLWNRIIEAENILEQDYFSELPTDLRADIASQFSFARLRLAAAGQANGEQTGVADKFSQEELSLVTNFDKYNLFDIQSPEELCDRMRRHHDIYAQAQEYRREYERLDSALDSPQIRKDIKVFLKKKYKDRLHNVDEGLKFYIGKFGLSAAVEEIEKSVLKTIKSSERERITIASDMERHLQGLTSRLKNIDETDLEAENLKNKLDTLQAQFASGGVPPHLMSLESEKDSLAGSYSNYEKELSNLMETIEKKARALAEREEELEKSKQEYRKQMQEEKQRLVEGELKEIEALKGQLAAQSSTLQHEKNSLEIRRQEISDRLRQLNEIAGGMPIRYIVKEDARKCELDFITRFDTKMNTFPVRFFSPIESKTHEIHQWKDDDHFITSERSTPDVPWNTRSLYLVQEKKYGFFGEKTRKAAIEAVSFNHLAEFEQFGYDSRRANRAEFLALITRLIDQAESGKYLHVIGIASPTGWDEKLTDEFKSSGIIRNYISRFVSFCLIDAVTGELHYNPADERVSGMVEYFRLEFNHEKVSKVTKYILGRLGVNDYVVLDEVVKETGEPRAIVNKVFYDIQQEGKTKVRYIKDIGLVLQTSV